jgi:predicted phosphoribosyltransferase
MRFIDRTDAGRQLAAKLAERYEGKEGVVYALPRGGVVLGVEIARRLRMPLDLIIARKIGHPHNAEYAIGAVTEEGEIVRSPYEVGNIPEEWFAHQAAAEREEARRRHQLYVGGRPLLSAAGKTAILVDDGIATGLTMEAAIRGLRLQEPKRIVVAVPVVPSDTAAKLAREIDEVVAVDIARDYLGAVGAYYDDFPQISDEQVVALLQAARASTPIN